MGFCETHTQVRLFLFIFVRAPRALIFAGFAAALSQRAGRDSAALCGECTTSQISGLQVYLAPARLHPEAFGMCLKQQPGRLLQIPDLEIVLRAELMNDKIFTTRE